MLKKIVVLCLVSFWGLTNCFAKVTASLDQAKENVLSLVYSGDYANAKSATDKLIKDFSNDQNLPDALYPIAELQEWPGKFQETKRLYQLIVQQHPDSTLAGRARLGISRVDILSLIMLSRDFDSARVSIDKMEADFFGNPDLSETLYWITERYRWLNRFEDEKRVYQKIVQNYPASPYVSKAELGLLRATVMSNIMTEDFAGAEAALNKMKADFSNHPDLPETLYWITERYRWFSKFDEEKQLYQDIIQKNPNSSYAEKAKLGITRVDVMALIRLQDFDTAKDTLDKMINDFAKHPDLPESLFWIAERYEWLNKFTEAKGVYQQIIQKYPKNSYADRAKLSAVMADVRSLIISRDYDKADQAIKKAANDFTGHPDWPRHITLAGEQYYKEGLAIQSAGLSDKVKDSFERAMAIWERFIVEYPDSELIPEVCCWAGDCYIKMNKYEDSLRCFQKVADNYPSYKHASHALFMVGRNYESMKDLGLISESVADPKIKAAYTRLLKEYPNCTPAKIAQEWIESKNSK